MTASVEEGFVIRWGGWNDGDNYKRGLGWYFVCRKCRHVGIGQLLAQSAIRETKKHRCPA